MALIHNQCSLKIESYADSSFDTGIVLEKRSVRLKAFPWKATSKAYALPLNFHRNSGILKKFGGNSDRKDNPSA
ncbi:MAG TPA: hypothetical protein VGI33_10030 [Paenibacillus sp.]|jgi:hypothetical protein